MEPDLNHLTLWLFCRSGRPSLGRVGVIDRNLLLIMGLQSLHPSLKMRLYSIIILKLSQQARREVHQQYTVVTFNLTVAKKAYSFVWQRPEELGDVIVHMGTFHLTYAFIGALGKKM